jgi:hypothetical protein
MFTLVPLIPVSYNQMLSVLRGKIETGELISGMTFDAASAYYTNTADHDYLTAIAGWTINDWAKQRATMRE